MQASGLADADAVVTDNWSRDHCSVLVLVGALPSLHFVGDTRPRGTSSANGGLGRHEVRRPSALCAMACAFEAPINSAQQ
jgi:hypothetical protein